MKTEEQHNNWTPAIEKSMKMVGDLSIGYKWMHNTSSLYLARIYRHVTYAAIVIGAMSTVLIVLDTGFVRQTHPTSIVLPLLAGIFSFVVSVMIALLKFTNLYELSRIHQVYASKYAGLVSNVRRQLAFDSSIRENAHDYVTWLNKNYDELFELSPAIKTKVSQKYRAYARSHDLPIPEEDLTAVLIVDPLVRSESIGMKVREFHNLDPIRSAMDVENTPNAPVNLMDISPDIQRYLEDVKGSDIHKEKRSLDPLQNYNVRPFEGERIPVDIHKMVMDQEKFDDSTMRYELNRWKRQL